MAKKVRKASFKPQVQLIVPLPSQYRVEAAEGSAYADPNTKTVYASRRDPFAMAHEIGHMLDEQLTSGDRARFQRIMRMKGPWDQGTGTEGGYHSPSESFADYYAAAATAYDPNGNRVTSAYTNLRAKRLRKFKKALDRVAREQHLRQYGSDGVGAFPTAQQANQAAIARNLTR